MIPKKLNSIQSVTGNSSLQQPNPKESSTKNYSRKVIPLLTAANLPKANTTSEEKFSNLIQDETREADKTADLTQTNAVSLGAKAPAKTKKSSNREKAILQISRNAFALIEMIFRRITPGNKAVQIYVDPTPSSCLSPITISSNDSSLKD